MQTATTAGNTVNVMTLPRVRAFAQVHYNCSSVTGFELEDGGGSGTASAHWELRVGRNEIMTGFADRELVISNITLSLFRDTGWYSVNYSLAEPFYMGSGQGCNFPLGKCSTWTQRATFCSIETGPTTCTVDRRAKGYCDYEDNIGSTIPAAYRYFSSSTAGSANPSKDYCPTIESYSNGVCVDVDAFASGVNGEEVGYIDSRCFEVGSNIACLRHRCSGGYLEVLLGGTWTACNGTSVNWAGRGAVTCARELCAMGPVGSDLYTYTPPPPQNPRPQAATSPGGAQAPNAAFLYYFTNDAALFYGAIIGGCVFVLLVIIIIATCCCKKK